MSGISRISTLVENLSSGKVKMTPATLLKMWFSLNAGEKSDLKKLFTTLRDNGWRVSSIDDLQLEHISESDRQQLAIMALEAIESDPDLLNLLMN